MENHRRGRAGPLGSGNTVWRFVADYWMLGVLALLGAVFSLLTIQEQDRAGADAAVHLAHDIAADAPPAARVFIVAKAGEEDARFADTLEDLLKRGGFQVAGRSLGEPRDAVKALREVAAAGGRVDLIATTKDCAGWPALAGLGETVPALAKVPVRSPAGYTWPTFLKTDNLLNVASQIVVIAVIAIGMTMVIITGGIDLSVGSLVALSAVVAAWLIRYAGGENASTGGMTLACLGAIAACGAVGAFSGAVITLFRIPPFIATLAMMQVASGLAFLLAEGQSIYQIPEAFTWLGRGADLFGIPNAVLLMAALYAAAWVLMSRTVLGRHIYAVGSNAATARLSGIRVRRVLLLVYLASGLAAGLGGVVTAHLTQRRKERQRQKKRSLLEKKEPLFFFAALREPPFGTSLAGGEGRVLGTLIGAFLIAVIWNGMNLTKVESYTQKVVLGLVILAAVLVDTLKNRSWPWRSLQRPNT
jgi:ribose transport system permease protein